MTWLQPYSHVQAPRWSWWIGTGLLMAWSLVGSATAGETGPSEVKQRYGVAWHDSLQSALSTAETGDPRPVMWFRVLGDLDGFM